VADHAAAKDQLRKRARVLEEIGSRGNLLDRRPPRSATGGRAEELFLVGEGTPLYWPGLAGLHMLRACALKAHRFAITDNGANGQKASCQSHTRGNSGLGPVKGATTEEFGGLKGIVRAGIGTSFNNSAVWARSREVNPMSTSTQGD